MLGGPASVGFEVGSGSTKEGVRGAHNAVLPLLDLRVMGVLLGIDATRLFFLLRVPAWVMSRR